MKRLLALLCAAVSVLAASLVTTSASANTSDTYYLVRGSATVAVGSWGNVTAYCETGDIVVGGGVTLNNWPTSQTRVSAPRAQGSDSYASYWYAQVYNGDTIDRDAFVDIQCVHLGS